MNTQSSTFIKNYSSIILLLVGIIVGSILGLVLGKQVEIIKPLGDIFLNLLFTAVVPLMFFAIASSIANIEKSEKIGKLLIMMVLVFLSTMLISAFVMVLGTYIFPIHQSIALLNIPIEAIEKETIGAQITQLVTATEFFELLSRKNMLAFIIFSFLMGISSLRAKKSGEEFRQFLNSGNEVMKELLEMIMKFAPIGLGAYFGYQVGVFGPELFGIYAKSVGLCYGVGFFYFVVFFSLYAFVAGGAPAIKMYWKNNIVPSLTALGTCSSVASIPANLEATEQMNIPPYVRNVVIPLGSSLHKEGSVLSAMMKIALLFAMFGRDFMDVNTILIAVGITIVVSVAEGGIPNGGYIGEALVISIYGLPLETLPILMIITTLLDPITTLLNVTGDTVSAMLITRFSEGKKWMYAQAV
jgi:Na+/H+-dicarboxylate symporter